MMTVSLLILHSLLAVALLGAITHQTISAWAPTSRGAAGSFVTRMRAVPPTSYVNAVILLYGLTALLGAIIYPSYRLNVRIVLEQMQLHIPNGAFELKEHFVAVGLGMLPAYWYFWRAPQVAEYQNTRAVLTAMLAFIVWWGFVVGHILNNIRGFDL
jgi:predicted transporter